MTRLSREQKRELKRAGRVPAGLTPIDVRVSAEAGATVGGMPVPPAAGESLQSAALDYLHRLALATGHPVLATVHDERIGYVVPLRIHVDGSSHYAGEPVRVGEPRGFAAEGAPAVREGAAVREGEERIAPGMAAPAHLGEGTDAWTAPEPPASAPAQAPRRDRSTHVLRAVPESAATGRLPQEQGDSRGAHPQAHTSAHPHQDPNWQPRPEQHAQADPGRAPQTDAERRSPAEWQPHGGGEQQPRSGWQQQGESGREPQVGEPRARSAEWQARSVGQAPAQVPSQPEVQQEWQPQAGPEGSAHPEQHRPQPTAQPDVRPDARPESQSHPQGQAKREPSTMRLAAGDPAPSAEPVASTPEPERPKREPSTLPLTAAKPTSGPFADPTPAPAPAEPPPARAQATEPPPPSPAPNHASSTNAPTPESAAAPHAQPAAQPVKPQPRTMPLTAAKEKQGERVDQGDASQPASGGVVPSTFVLRAVPEPQDGPLARPPRTPGLPLTLPGVPVDSEARPSAPEPAQDLAPAAGTVSPPTGEFGPLTDPEPPPIGTASPSWHQDRAAAPPQPSTSTPRSAPASLNPQPWPPAPTDAPTPEPAHTPSPGPTPESGPASLEPQPWPPTPTPGPAPMPIHPQPTAPTPEPAPPATLAPPAESASDAYSAPEWKVLEEDTAPKPAPVREFDAVAEAVLDPAEDGGTPSPFAEPVSRINEAVKLGRIQEAAEMAEQTVAQATATLGPQHPEVLKLRELTAYIAYLAGDALRSFHLSLDLAGLRHRMRDQRAAYGNIQSAAAAWRAVRDPLQGLHLGRDLIAVWTDLAADAGPAADDLEQLEKARTRMTRLTDRARALDSAPYAHGQ
ncbi:hypothetical protein [Streptomyces akebiae]|uniref:Tetratricopeptide repeat protein n=1 Tax=Streptomyces akebiae TaxID=2865673 RepID=A0ABX8XQQ1_9ACTN|nr:hypothetical protein [Streptomyces akebiae]QYX78129.1 hypothetical protein K1J60_17660 [Streptomyces akebiae]